jgi:hypothetical protein
LVAVVVHVRAIETAAGMIAGTRRGIDAPVRRVARRARYLARLLRLAPEPRGFVVRFSKRLEGALGGVERAEARQARPRAESRALERGVRDERREAIPERRPRRRRRRNREREIGGTPAAATAALLVALLAPHHQPRRRAVRVAHGRVATPRHADAGVVAAAAARRERRPRRANGLRPGDATQRLERLAVRPERLAVPPGFERGVSPRLQVTRGGSRRLGVARVDASVDSRAFSVGFWSRASPGHVGGAGVGFFAGGGVFECFFFLAEVYFRGSLAERLERGVLRCRPPRARRAAVRPSGRRGVRRRARLPIGLFGGGRGGL